MASMNLDEALASAEMAKQYPSAPAMPIKAPSDPQQPSSGGSRQSSSNASSQRQTPQSDGQVTIASPCMPGQTVSRFGHAHELHGR